MKIAVGFEGFIIPHVVKIEKIVDFVKPGEDPNKVETGGYKRFYFIVFTTGGVHRVEDNDREKIEEKRKQIINDVNSYYGVFLDV